MIFKNRDELFHVIEDRELLADSGEKLIEVCLIRLNSLSLPYSMSCTVCRLEQRLDLPMDFGLKRSLLVSPSPALIV